MTNTNKRTFAKPARYLLLALLASTAMVACSPKSDAPVKDIVRDKIRAAALYKQACDGGYTDACER